MDILDGSQDKYFGEVFAVIIFVVFFDSLTETYSLRVLTFS